MPALTLAFAAASALLSPQQWPAGWTAPVEPFTIAEDLHYVGPAALAVYLITSDDGHILIDATLDENVPMILDNIRTLGFDPADVEVVLASHGHFDHTAGMASMVEATGAELVLSEAGAELVGSGGRTDFFVEEIGWYAPARADRVIGHLETVTVGDHTLTAHLTPGHTRGCTTWSGEVEIEGEALTFVSVCSLNVLQGYRLWGDEPSYPGIGRDFCRSVAHLRTLEPDIFLGSHGGFFGMADKVRALRAGDARAFVDPDRYVAYLDRAEQVIERTLAEQGHQGGCAALLGS